MKRWNKFLAFVMSAMLIGTLAFAETAPVNNVVTVGGQTYGYGQAYAPNASSPSVVPVSNGSSLVTLFGVCTNAANYTTLRVIGGSSGYLVSGNGFLILDMNFNNSSVATVSNMIGWGTSDIGISNSSPPTAYQAVYYNQSVATAQTRETIKMKFPASTYITGNCNPSSGQTGYIQVTGIAL